MFKVAKEFRFNYAHRLLGSATKCARLHGHSARVLIEMAGKSLDRKGMVIDFFEIQNTIGKWIDARLDHRMILNRKDPLVNTLRKAGEPVVAMNGNPTAELLAQWIFREARRMKLPVSRVTFWENDGSSAAYAENPKHKTRIPKQ